MARTYQVVKEDVYTGRDNRIDLRLYSDYGQEAQLANLTRVTIEAGGVTHDSDINPADFDWTQGNGELRMMLGGAGFAVGTHDATLVLYDSSNPGGILWTSPDAPQRLELQVS